MASPGCQSAGGRGMASPGCQSAGGRGMASPGCQSAGGRGTGSSSGSESYPSLKSGESNEESTRERFVGGLQFYFLKRM